jgi:DNA mismatch endonuclease, patch repair protein
VADVMSKAARSRLMASIRGKDTRPEMLVRRYLHAAGLRFRLHDRLLPGRPDLVFKRHRVAVFVNGCFWHRHPGCTLATEPTSNVEFWGAKFEANVSRDAWAQSALRELGWTPLKIWECEGKVVEGLDRLFWRIVAASCSFGR